MWDILCYNGLNKKVKLNFIYYQNAKQPAKVNHIS